MKTPKGRYFKHFVHGFLYQQGNNGQEGFPRP